MDYYGLEYENLRIEADNDKRYIFERPILIVTVSLAAINFGAVDYFPFIPAFITFMLCFNLLFTANRLLSATRITSYILVVIERDHRPYIGWENLMLHYRELTHKLGRKRVKRLVKEELDRSLLPKRGGFYQIIYWFHIFILFVTYSGFILKKNSPSLWVVLFSLIPILWFLYLLVVYHNNRFRKQLIVENILMEKVLAYVQDKRVLEELMVQYSDKRGTGAKGRARDHKTGR